jgi:catechol 2,3-dioxygenase-like lactoylglutathione lyase family enzyme
MLDHIGVQVADVETSAALYLKVFAPLGFRELMRYPAGNSFVVGICGGSGQPQFWLSPAERDQDRELHIAFVAPDRAAVDAVYQAAVEAGVQVLHAPREWPEYHPGYYGVFLRDPGGHNVEAVFHGEPQPVEG